MGDVTLKAEQVPGAATDQPWLRWSGTEVAGLLLLSLLFIFFTYHGTNPEKSAFYDLNPNPDCVEYIVEASRIYHGMQPDLVINGHAFPSRYPLGFPLTLAAMHPLLGGSTRLVIVWTPILFTLASLWVFYALVRHRAGAVAAWSGTILYATNPCTLTLATGLYSESLLALVTLLTVGVFLEALESGGTRASLLFGICFGFSLLVRIQVVITVPIFLAAYLYLSKRRIEMRPLLYASCGAIPFLVVQAILQWRQFGSPMTTGYAYHLQGLKLFSLAYLATGLKYYIPALFLGGRTACGMFVWVFVPAIIPVLTAVGMVAAWRRGGHRPVVVCLLFLAITFFFFCSYLFTDIRFFLQVLLLFFAWSGVGIAWLAGRMEKYRKAAVAAAILLITLIVPIGNRKTPALFAMTLRSTPQVSIRYMNVREIHSALRKVAQPHTVLLTAENLALLDFYSDEFVLYPLSKSQEYARVPEIGRFFPESIDSLLKKGCHVFMTDLNTQGKWDTKALAEIKEDFELSVVPCHLYGNATLYEVIARKQPVSIRDYWGG